VHVLDACARGYAALKRERRKLSESERERERIVLVDFTVMINRHRIFIVLGLDGWGCGPDRALYFGQYKEPPRA